MKTSLFFTVAGLLVGMAASQAHGSHHQHVKRHGPRKVVQVIETKTAVVTGPEVIVYMDGNGQPVSTTTLQNSQAPPTPAPQANPAPAPAPVPAPAPAPQQPQPQPQPQPHPQPAPAPGPQPAPAPPAQPNNPSSGGGSVSTGPGFKSGVSYSPYNGDNSCKSAQQVAKDFIKIGGYQVIRLYGTDCNQVANVLAATKGRSMKLFLGIFDLAQVQKEAETISKALNGDWSRINAISVGNEMVNKGTDPGTVIGALGQARGLLKSSGYSGPIVTVDTMMAMVNHPELCKASDFCAINCHAFFDGKTPPEKSGDFVKMWVDKIGKATGKTVVVTETGWPSQGDRNNVAVPSPQNHQAAISSIGGALPENVIYYSAYNDLWKKNFPGSFNAEQYWGILGNAPSA
ncbi:MAG: hypothetical protein LQ346_002957 [Caloplaca aetnensis]|nr:MAG: hypothetical protein LQ346_002957 [Caloplaca aetnensis]